VGDLQYKSREILNIIIIFSIALKLAEVLSFIDKTIWIRKIGYV